MADSKPSEILYPLVIPLKYLKRIKFHVDNGIYSSIDEFVIQAIVDKLLEEEIFDI